MMSDNQSIFRMKLYNFCQENNIKRIGQWDWHFDFETTNDKLMNFIDDYEDNYDPHQEIITDFSDTISDIINKYIESRYDNSFDVDSKLDVFLEDDGTISIKGAGIQTTITDINIDANLKLDQNKYSKKKRC